MPAIKIERIVVGERFRVNMGDLEGLASSIENVGLIEPIVIDEDLRLVAGGRRLEACKLLGHTSILCRQLKELDDFSRRQIELEENIHRKDMTWQEEVLLKQEIDTLYKKKYGERKPGQSSSKGWSVKDTALAMDESDDTTRRDIELASMLDIVPELSECKTKKEAQRKYKKLLEDLAVRELAKRKKKESTTVTKKAPKKEDVKSSNDDQLKEIAAQIYEIGNSSYIIGDAVKGLRSQSIESFDLAEVDPPYGIDLKKVKRSDSNRHYNEIEAEAYGEFLGEVAGSLYPVLAKDAWVVWWFGIQWIEVVRAVLTSKGFSVPTIPCVWTKTQGQTNRPELYLANGWEAFFIARKGSPIMTKQGRLNVFNYPAPGGAGRIHDTERPVELVADILQTLVTPGSNIVSPFLGSGNTVRAAVQCEMNCIGWDITGKDYKNSFLSRLVTDFLGG